jgi:hypothetical protein
VLLRYVKCRVVIPSIISPIANSLLLSFMIFCDCILNRIERELTPPKMREVHDSGWFVIDSHKMTGTSTLNLAGGLLRQQPDNCGAGRGWGLSETSS